MSLRSDILRKGINVIVGGTTLFSTFFGGYVAAEAKGNINDDGFRECGFTENTSRYLEYSDEANLGSTFDPVTGRSKLFNIGEPGTLGFVEEDENGNPKPDGNISGDYKVCTVTDAGAGVTLRYYLRIKVGNN